MFLKTVLIAVSLIAVSHTFKLQPRIFRGSNSSRGQFPYFVLLEIISTNDSVLMCGGSLIDKEWVLTAGHCIENETVIDLHFGSFSVEDTSEAGRVVMTVKKENLILHPDYLDEGTHYDIGLIKLPKPIELSRYIQPIELDMKCDLNEIFNVTVVGNGGISTYGDVASTLQYAYLETTRMDICEALFPFIDNRISVRCVRGKNLESLCPGDSGGPVVTTATKKLVGITSFARPEGCESGFPQGVTWTAFYHKWISRKTGLDIPVCDRMLI